MCHHLDEVLLVGEVSLGEVDAALEAFGAEVRLHLLCQNELLRRSCTVANDELGSLDTEDLSGVHLKESLFIDELAVEVGHHELLADHHLVQGRHVLEICWLLVGADRRCELRAEVGRRGCVDCRAIHASNFKIIMIP